MTKATVESSERAVRWWLAEGGVYTEENGRKKKENFHSEWEEEFSFTTVKENWVCLICGVKVATAKWHNVERHFSMCNKSYHATHQAAHYGRESLQVKGFFTRLVKKSQKTTEVSFRAAHFLIKKKNAFSDGEVFKEAMMLIANTVFKDERNGTDVIFTLSDVQLGQVRWWEEFRLCPGTWPSSWTGTWWGAGGLESSATSPWTTAVQRSWWSSSGWCLMISPQKKNFHHELYQEQTQNMLHWCTSARLPQSCSLKLHPRLQYTGNSMQCQASHKQRQIQTPDVVSANMPVP